VAELGPLLGFPLEAVALPRREASVAAHGVGDQVVGRRGRRRLHRRCRRGGVAAAAPRRKILVLDVENVRAAAEAIIQAEVLLEACPLGGHVPAAASVLGARGAEEQSAATQQARDAERL